MNNKNLEAGKIVLLPRLFRVVAMSGQESPAAATNTQIMMRAPEGEVGWVMIDMQGTLETRNGQPLDGVEFGTLIREVRHKCATSLFPHSAVAPGSPAFPPAGPCASLLRMGYQSL